MKQDTNSNNEIKIKLNPFSIMYKGRASLLSSGLILSWIVSVLIIVLMYYKPSYFFIKKIDLFSISDFLAPAITGLSFTLALIVATNKLFSKDQLVAFYKYDKGGTKETGYLFYGTLAPYIFTSTVWLIVAVGALLAKLFVFDFSNTSNEVIKILYSTIVLLGLISLWSLLTMHIQDLALEAERALKKEDKEDKEETKESS